MESCDALIVGGGPAGSSCAGELRRAGLDVLVLDRASFPRDKPCAGWITPQVLEALGLTPEEYGRGRVMQPITSLRTGRIGATPIETRYAGVVSFGIRRCEFDEYLLRRSGARARTGAPVTRIRRDGGDWVVNEEIRAPLLIGAGGHFCPVARFLGGGGGAEPIVAAQEVEFRMAGAQLSECAAAGEEPELYFCADWKGYGWIFRKGDYLNVGFGRQDTRGLSAHTGAFVAWLREQGRIPGRLSGRWRGHAYLLWESTPRPLVGEGMMLVGDAAGLAYSPSGEGIRPAVESGLLAARAAAAAAGRYRREDLEPYREAVAARLGRRGTFAPLLAPLLGVVPGGLARRLGARLLRSPTWTRRVLLDRWFLHVHQPAMARPAARAPGGVPPGTGDIAAASR